MSDARRLHVLFRFGQEQAALARGDVQEILPLPTLSRPAGLPRPLAGFLDLGGQATPVVSLQALFHGEITGATPDIYSHLLLTRWNQTNAALLVDRVLDVVETDAAAVLHADREDSLNGCVAGHLQHDGAIIPILALDRLLLEAERTRLEALTKDAQSRLGAWSPA